jgi:hypothetical protein
LPTFRRNVMPMSSGSKSTIFRDVKPCSLAQVRRRSRRAYCKGFSCRLLLAEFFLGWLEAVRTSETSVMMELHFHSTIFLHDTVLRHIITYCLRGGGGCSWFHLVRRPLIGLLYQPRMVDDDECGAVCGMRIGRGNRSTRRKPAPVPLCPSQIPHDLTWAWTRAAAVGSRPLTACAMARPSM